jgi:hypothetical protein
MIEVQYDGKPEQNLGNDKEGGDKEKTWITDSPCLPVSPFPVLHPFGTT